MVWFLVYEAFDMCVPQADNETINFRSCSALSLLCGPLLKMSEAFQKLRNIFVT